MCPPSKGAGPRCCVCIEDRSVPAGLAVLVEDTRCLVHCSCLGGHLVPCPVLQRQEEEGIPQSAWDFPLETASPCWLERGNKIKNASLKFEFETFSWASRICRDQSPSAVMLPL